MIKREVTLFRIAYFVNHIRLSFIRSVPVSVAIISNSNVAMYLLLEIILLVLKSGLFSVQRRRFVNYIEIQTSNSVTIMNSVSAEEIQTSCLGGYLFVSRHREQTLLKRV
jgi:hypothetical protein